MKEACWLTGSSVGAAGTFPASWSEIRHQLLERCPSRQRQGKAFVVVDALPLAEMRLGLVQRRELMAAPELFVIDAVAGFDLATLLGPARLDVAVANAVGLDGEAEGQRKLCPVVALELPNREREHLLELLKEVQAHVLIEPRIEAQDAEARAVVQCRVLEDSGPLQLDDLDVDLDGLSRLLFLKQLQLWWPPSRRLTQRRQAETANGSLNRPRVDVEVVHTTEPDLRSRRAPPALRPNDANQFQRCESQSSCPMLGASREETLVARGFPPGDPGSDRVAVKAEVPTGPLDPMFPGVFNHATPLLDTELVPSWNSGVHTDPSSRSPNLSAGQAKESILKYLPQRRTGAERGSTW